MKGNVFKRLQRIDHLIQIKGTGSAQELADKIGVSRRCIYDYINLMKEYGAPIKFDAYRQSYYYTMEGEVKMAFFPKYKDEPNSN